jgi:hypothetical protein
LDLCEVTAAISRDRKTLSLGALGVRERPVDWQIRNGGVYQGCRIVDSRRNYRTIEDSERVVFTTWLDEERLSRVNIAIGHKVVGDRTSGTR